LSLDSVDGCTHNLKSRAEPKIETELPPLQPMTQGSGLARCAATTLLPWRRTMWPSAREWVHLICFCASNKRPLTVPLGPQQCCKALSMPPISYQLHRSATLSRR